MSKSMSVQGLSLTYDESASSMPARDAMRGKIMNRRCEKCCLLIFPDGCVMREWHLRAKHMRHTHVYVPVLCLLLCFLQHEL